MTTRALGSTLERLESEGVDVADLRSDAYKLFKDAAITLFAVSILQVPREFGIRLSEFQCSLWRPYVYPMSF